MDVDEIRRLVKVHPFRPFELHLDAGEKYLITHPEIIIHEVMVVAVDHRGELVYIAPEAISAIRFAPKRGGRARRRR